MGCGVSTDYIAGYTWKVPLVQLLSAPELLGLLDRPETHHQDLLSTSAQVVLKTAVRVTVALILHCLT